MIVGRMHATQQLLSGFEPIPCRVRSSPQPWRKNIRESSLFQKSHGVLEALLFEKSTCHGTQILRHTLTLPLPSSYLPDRFWGQMSGDGGGRSRWLMGMLQQDPQQGVDVVQCL
ncbi:hypothetical protein BaRGS_00013292 [Batillaria attramentaria]|uniref:Uncharacterized protein n=1 Tax=Batillaria attramentaria TaxID=370345 RepID=A0ABD0L7A3_9CAEN